jgi:hypothetical protein
VVEYNNYLDNGNDVGPYYFGVYYPEFDADDDFLWLNAHASFEGMAAGNADWEVNGKDMQARFNEISTCRSPDIYNSWMLRSVEE